MKKPRVVKRELFIKAESGSSLYCGPKYASSCGNTLLDSVRSEVLSFDAEGRPCYLTGRLSWRRSTDNGATWQEWERWDEQQDDISAGRPMSLGTFLLPAPNVVIERSIMPSGWPVNDITLVRSYTRFSLDEGISWSDWQQVIDSRPQYDAATWAPGVTVGKLGGVSDGQSVLIDDGSVMTAFTIRRPKAPASDISERAKEISSYVMSATARWDDVASGLEWRFGGAIDVPFPEACGGCCEPSIARLDGDRWMITMRCQGDQKLNIYSRRMATISEDGGETWSKPTDLTYEDKSPVWMPASMQRFFRSEKNGKTYLIGNILDRPVHAQTPRYPLSLAEFDTARGVVRRDTIMVIDDRPPGAPVDRRYTNFGFYEDRQSGELVLTLPEHPQHKNYAEMSEPSDYTGDALIYRIEL